jgi:acylphosphatase
MYKLIKTNRGESLNRNNENGSVTVIPFDPDNTDYAQFKKAISEETAQLQDAEGNLMTAQAAKDFIKELP